MAFASGTVDVGETPVPLCAAGNAGVRLKNTGQVRAFAGGPGVTADGYPLDPGRPELLYGGQPKEAPIVPAPPGDLAGEVLYACTAPGTGTTRVSWIGIT